MPQCNEMQEDFSLPGIFQWIIIQLLKFLCGFNHRKFVEMVNLHILGKHHLHKRCRPMHIECPPYTTILWLFVRSWFNQLEKMEWIAAEGMVVFMEKIPPTWDRTNVFWFCMRFMDGQYLKKLWYPWHALSLCRS